MKNGSIPFVVFVLMLGMATSSRELSAAQPRARLLHQPVHKVVEGQPIVIRARVEYAWAEKEIWVRYRSENEQKYKQVPLLRSSSGGFFAKISPKQVQRPSVVYYIVGTTDDGEDNLHFASPETPHRVAVEPPSSALFKEKELARLHGRVSTLDVETAGYFFRHNDPDFKDWFTVSGFSLTHRTLGSPYALVGGLKYIHARTRLENADGRADRNSAYGHGGLTLRLHASMWLSGHIVFGMGKDGLFTGGGGALTLGRPWRANVSFGVEELVSVGPTLWIRLQWDTVPSALMGAKVWRTRMPSDSEDDDLGNATLVSIDATFPVGERISVRGEVSMGARGGSLSPGGRLSMSVAF